MLKHVTIDGVRIHLKTDEKKLWINSKYVLYLNGTTNFILESMIDSYYEVPKEKVPEETVKKILQKYKVSKEKAEKDFHAIIGMINNFARDEPPFHLIGMKIIDNKDLKAPGRMDLSLTYKCNNDCTHCYLKENKNKNGILDTQKWKTIIDKLWEIGIPQIVFTGGECTLQEDLVELVDYSKQFITGIITNGTLLTSVLAKKLKDAHLDWIQITLESHNEMVHDEMQGRKGAWSETVLGIKNAVQVGLSVSINATLTKKNYSDLNGLIEFANQLGVKFVSTNAIIKAGRGIKEKSGSGLDEKELNIILKEAKKHAENLGIQLNWFLPTCYHNLNPMELGFGQRCCSACSINMMIEPNGDVIPCQSWTHQTLGNILTDNWNKIWNSHLSKDIRNHVFMQENCKDCEHIDLCSGACPLDVINAGEQI